MNNIACYASARMIRYIASGGRKVLPACRTPPASKRAFNSASKILGKAVKVYLDGVEQHDAITADANEGFVKRNIVSEQVIDIV